MGVTTTTADAALKNVYFDVLKDALNIEADALLMY